MAGKRVLGDDPFAESSSEAESATKPDAASKPRTSRKPPAGEKRATSRTPSRAPAAKGAGRKSRAPAARDAVAAGEASDVRDAGEAGALDPTAMLASAALRAPAIPREASALREMVPAAAGPEESGASLEAQLEALLARAEGQGDVEAQRTLVRLRTRLAVAPTRSEAPPAATREEAGRAEGNPLVRVGGAGVDFDVAREVLGTEFYRRHWGRSAMRDREEEVDDFGLDPKFALRFRPLFDFMYERWWRVEVRGVERVPERGAVMLCANHAGAVPYDGVMLSTALRREHAGRRELRWLAEDFVFHAPFLGVFMNRVGAVRACQENAARLLSKGACVGVFPEGIKGISKPYSERYKLQRFGRGGHVKLAMRTGTPIVPVAIVGAEETHPMIAPSRFLGEAVGLPFLPLTPTFPWLGAAGLVPLPSKWSISFLEPIPVDELPREGADDDALVGRVNERIRVAIQQELDRVLAARTSAFRG